MNTSMVLLPHTKLDLLERLCTGFEVVDLRVMGYSEEKSKLLKFLFDGGYIEWKTVEDAVHEYLLELGCAMQVMHLRTRTFPDHLGSDALFGYAMKHEKVRPADVTFDHGETAGEYILASDGLLDDILGQLLTYKKLEMPQTFLQEIDSCCGGCC